MGGLACGEVDVIGGIDGECAACAGAAIATGDTGGFDVGIITGLQLNVAVSLNGRAIIQTIALVEVILAIPSDVVLIAGGDGA